MTMRRKTVRPDDKCEMPDRENINALELSPEHLQGYLEVSRAENYFKRTSQNAVGRVYEGVMLPGNLDSTEEDVNTGLRKMFGKGTGKRWRRLKPHSY